MNSAAAITTVTQASRTRITPRGIRVRRSARFRASNSRSTMRFTAIATQRAHVNASTTQSAVSRVSGASRDANVTPTRANGSAKIVWGSFTKLAQRANRDAPAKV